jgi:hypothetical protein
MRIVVESGHADPVFIVRAFGTDFEGARHGRRVDQTADVEGRAE